MVDVVRRFWKSSKKPGYDFAAHVSSSIVTAESAFVAPTATDMAMRWSPNDSNDPPENLSPLPKTVNSFSEASVFTPKRSSTSAIAATLSDSFIPGNYAVSGGTAEEQELRAGDHLEIVEFSDFQVHPVTGDIAGEIRLGYLRRGGKTTVVTGGSVSGSMNDFVKTLRMSKESRQYNNTLIPAATMLKDVTVTGAE